MHFKVTRLHTYKPVPVYVFRLCDNVEINLHSVVHHMKQIIFFCNQYLLATLDRLHLILHKRPCTLHSTVSLKKNISE